MNDAPIEERIAWRYFALKAAKISQTEVANRLGVTQQTINGVMTGVRTSYMVSAAITIMTGEDHVRMWGEPARKPTPAQAENLERHFAHRWCAFYPEKRKQQYAPITRCFNCVKYEECKK